MSSLKQLTRIICLSAGFKQLCYSYRPDWLVERAMEAAEACSKCEDPVSVVIYFASTYANQLNALSVEAMEMHAKEIEALVQGKEIQDLLALIGDEEGPSSDDAALIDGATVGIQESLNYESLAEAATDVEIITEPIASTEVVVDVLVSDLAITSKQKAVLTLAGITTTSAVIAYHKEKTLESLNGIGPESQAHILNVIGFKE